MSLAKPMATVGIEGGSIGATGENDPVSVGMSSAMELSQLLCDDEVRTW
jgi:hypothetical protein